MTYTELQEKYNNVSRLIAGRQIKNSFDILSGLISESGNGDFRVQLQNYRDTYHNILKYSFEQVEDPQKEEIYNRLLRSIIELADEVKEFLINSKQMLVSYRAKSQSGYNKVISEKDYTRLIDSLTWNEELDKLYDSPDSKDKKQKIKLEHETSLKNIFYMLWFSDVFKDAELKLSQEVCNTSILQWHDKSLIVSGITLSLLRNFDAGKIITLFEFYKAREHNVWQRALIGLVIGLYKYDYRLSLYPEIQAEFNNLKSDNSIAKNFEIVIIQLIKSKDTEKITKKFQEEILPEMFKFKSRIDDKLDLGNILTDKFSDDKNPDWENVFSDSPDLLNKLEEFSMMQMDGSDVFLGTFSMLKQFDFFNEFSNWFMPFHRKNASVNDALSGINEDIDVEKFTVGLENSSFLCNSDKYSFCLNVKRIPSAHRSMMMEMFNMEMKAMDEIAREDNILNDTAKDKTVITQYIQDLYRFYKLFPLKNEFDDIFNWRLDVHNTSFFKKLVKEDNILRNIGEFYFEKNHFEEAIQIFKELSAKEENYELWQKIAYSYHQLENFSKALEYYHKAEYLDKNKAWNLNKIAFCYRKLKKYKKALGYYLEAEKHDPENLYVQTNLGHTYLDLKDYEKAMEYYFKVEYLAPDNHKVQRPIGWCSFVLGKFDNALKYFQKIVENEGNQSDYMNLAHVEWCMGNVKEAIEHYKQSLQLSKSDMLWFEKEFKEDKKFLIKHGIKSIDIPLMIDLLKFETSQA